MCIPATCTSYINKRSGLSTKWRTSFKVQSLIAIYKTSTREMSPLCPIEPRRRGRAPLPASQVVALENAQDGKQICMKVPRGNPMLHVAFHPSRANRNTAGPAQTSLLCTARKFLTANIFMDRTCRIVFQRNVPPGSVKAQNSLNLVFQLILI